MKKICIFLLSVCLLSSCSMPETKIYSLALPEWKESAKIKTGASINIFLHSPRYLSQSYIAYRSSPYQLQISRYSKWDSAPDEMLKEAFREALVSSDIFKEVKTSNFMSPGFYSLEVNLKRFERADNGEEAYGDLVFDITLLSPEGGELYRSAVSKMPKLEDKSFVSLARSMSGALSESIEEVMVSILKQLHAGI